MNRLDRLSESALFRSITNLRTSLDSLKTTQRLGSASILTNRIFSTNAIDIQLTSIVQLSSNTIEVTFTPASTTFDNLSIVYKMEYVLTASDTQVLVNVERLRPVDNIQKWRLYVSTLGNPTTYARFKFYFFANGPGSFTAVQV